LFLLPRRAEAAEYQRQVMDLQGKLAEAARPVKPTVPQAPTAGPKPKGA